MRTGSCDECLYWASIQIYGYKPRPYCARFGQYRKKPQKNRRCVKPINNDTRDERELPARP